MPDWLDIDSRVNNAIAKIDAVADNRIKQIDAIFDDKIEKIRELLNGISFAVVASEVRKPKE